MCYCNNTKNTSQWFTELLAEALQKSKDDARKARLLKRLLDGDQHDEDAA